jgi:predicted phosphodiesterase
MRYAIFSDVHSNLEALDAVVKAYQEERIDQYFCVGDVVGYATNPQECIQKVKSFTNIVIAGNHDWAAVDLFSTEFFNPLALEAIVWTKENLNQEDRSFLQSLKLTYQNDDFTLVHGTLENPESFDYMIDVEAAEKTFSLLKTGICFVGHSHIAGVFMKDEAPGVSYQEDGSLNLKPSHKYIVNVGSVGQPRDGNPKAAYCVFDTEKRQIQIKRVAYDVGLTRHKILQAGLPSFLGDRLLQGE